MTRRLRKLKPKIYCYKCNELGDLFDSKVIDNKVYCKRCLSLFSFEFEQIQNMVKEENAKQKVTIYDLFKVKDDE